MSVSENIGYNYEWPFFKERDGLRTWMPVLGQERDFLFSFPLWSVCVSVLEGR